MMIASRPVIFYLAGGETLVVAAGARWETVGRFEPRQGGDAESEYARLQDRLRVVRDAINAARAIHGGSPIE